MQSTSLRFWPLQDPQMKIAGRGGPLPEASFYGRLQTVLSKDAVI